MDLARATNEIVSLHEFLVDWLRGTCAKDEAVLTARFSAHFAADLTFADATGKLLGNADLVNGFRDEYGVAPRVEIEVKNVCVRMLAADFGVFTYEEHQRHVDNATPPQNGRITTVVLRDCTDSPTGVMWTHLQETLIAA